ncbi:MAG: ABC transporter permease [Saprospiraceae bacterium]|nr:ABC transporter permease [Lewinella sp.]
MKTIIRKLIRDWWRVKGQLLLFLLAATLSSWGISSVIYAYLMTSRDFEENFLESDPAQLVLTLNTWNDSLRTVLEAHPEVETVERREILSARIRDENREWMPMLIFVVEDWDRLSINRFEVSSKTDQWTQGLMIEKQGAGFLDLSAGIDYQLTDGIEHRVLLGGWVHDARLPPSTMEHTIYAYGKADQLLNDTGNGTFRILLKTRLRYPDRQQLNELAEALTVQIEKAGSEVKYFNIPPPGEHPHQNIVDGVAFLQKSFGWVLVFLGLILLSLIFLIWIYNQEKEVGILKAIGANQSSVYTSYLMVLVGWLLLCTLIGLPLGRITARFFSDFVAMIQNFDPIKRAFPVYVPVGIAFITVSVPLLIVFWPLSSMIRKRVRQNFQQTFSATFNGWVMKAQDLLPGVRFRYPFNNLFRRTWLSLLMIVLLSTGIGLFLLGSNLRYAIRADLDDFFANTSYPVRVQAKMSAEQSRFLAAMPGIASWVKISREPITFIDPETGVAVASVMKVLPSEYQFSEKLLIRGALEQNCPNCLYINQGYLDEFGTLPIGDKVSLIDTSGNTSTWIFAGVIKDIGASPQCYRFTEMPIEQVDEIGFQLEEEVKDESEVIKRIESAFAAEGIVITRLFSTARSIAMLEDHLDLSFMSIQALGGLTLILGLLGLLILTALIIRERTHEIGMLKAIGTSSKKIKNLIGWEISMITLLGSAVGLLLSIVFTPLFCELYGNMLLHTGFAPSRDWLMAVGTIMGFGVLQYILLRWYVSRQIMNRAATMLKKAY